MAVAERKFMNIFEAQTEEPEMGGMTAFAQAGIQIPVETGAAVMWYNSLSSGALDSMSYHAGCPVIFGQKRSNSCSHLPTCWLDIDGC